MNQQASSRTDALCHHCLLPVGRRPMQRTINGESRIFCCYGCCIADLVKGGSGEESETVWLLIRLGIGGFLSMNIMMFSLLLYSDSFSGPDAKIVPWIHLLLWLLATPALIVLGQPFLRDAWHHARRGHLTSSVLILVGVCAAYAYSTYATLQHGSRVYFDTASMVLMLFTFCRYLEAAGRSRAARDLGPLLAAEREWATVVDGGMERQCQVREIAGGALLRVKPGERIPVDGVVVEGEFQADEAIVTGESRRIAKSPGVAVIAGSINLDGVALIRCIDAGPTTRWAQICRSVRNALSQRTPMQRIADRILGMLVPIMLLLAGATMLFWLDRLPFDAAMLNGLAVLVVACPCAVGLAAPLATSLGIGRLARHGCVMRNPAALEALARLKLVAFDKTGTLTSGRAHLVSLHTDGTDSDEVLARAAGLDLHSSHDLARAIVAAAAARDIPPIAASNVRAIPGRGIRGIAGTECVAAGNPAMMDELGWSPSAALAAHARSLEQSGFSVVQVGWGDRVRAVLALDDTVLPEAPATLAALHRRGLRTMMLTGDHDGAACRIASAVGLTDWRSRLLPEDKQAVLNDQRRAGGPVAMVGDGLNDGPVLAEADVGIAVGSATDLASETADLVLPDGGFWLLPWIVDLSRAVRRTILTNLLWALGYNLAAVTLATMGLLEPILAAVIMAGSSVLVVLNSLRLEKFPEPVLGEDALQPKRQASALARATTASFAMEGSRAGHDA